MTDVRINFAAEPTLPDGSCLGVQGEHNAVRLVITLPEEMLTDATYHTLTVNGTESLWIEQTPNSDGAYRDEDKLYIPLTADMTQQTSVDLFVTAYRQAGTAVQLVNKTRTLHGLRLLHSIQKPPAPIGGLVPEVRALREAVSKRIAVVDALPDDAPADTAVYLLGDGFYLRTSDQWERLPQSGSPVIRIVDLYADLTTDAEENELAFVLNSGTTGDDPPEYCPAGFYVFNGTDWAYIGDRELPERVGALESLAHAHANKESVLDLFFAVEDTADLLDAEAPQGVYALALNDVYQNSQLLPAGFYRKVRGDWVYVGDATCRPRLREVELKAHVHANKTALDKWVELPTGAPRYGNLAVQTAPMDDVEVITSGVFTFYFDADLNAVQWPVTDAIETIKLISGTNYILLSDMVNDVTGEPLRVLTVKLGDEKYTYFSRAIDVYQPGWYDDNGHACGAPTVSGFRTDALVIHDSTVGDDVTYTGFGTLPPKAKAALRVFSQAVHTTEGRVDHPYASEDTVLRYNGTMEPNRKYAFFTNHSFALALPEMPWQSEDAQFVLYLECGRDLDVTFPAGTLFVGGLPDTKAGLHKIIGTWRPDARCWSVGCVTAEAAT